MKINLRLWLCSLPLVTLFTLNLTRDKVAAQIIPDNTLGSENSVVKTINPQLKHIDGGAIRGINLFHSFREFNINEGNSAYFSNPAAIRNIFTRVMGNNPSQLFGKLGVLGDANLYFFNPNGIIFGRNASLDIRGSFVASTTPSLIFPDNKKFSATNPEAPPLLTNNVSIPVGLQFEGMSGTITNAANLKVGKDLKLVSENLDLENQIHAGKDLTLQATDTVKIRDSNDNPFIATAGGKLQISGDRNVDIFALNNPNSGLFSAGDMLLRSSKQVGGDAHFTAGGNFRIEKLDGSLGDLYSPFDPVIFAVGDVSLGDYAGASLHILAGGSVNLGNVDIFSADSPDNTINPNNNIVFNSSDTVASLANVRLSDGTELTIDGTSKPTLDVRAGIDWSSFEGGIPGNINTGFVSPSLNNTATSADINVGNINIFLPFTDGGKVFLSNQYRPNSSLSGNITVNGGIDTVDIADGGDITVDSRGGISLGGNIDASSFANLGKGGDVTLLAKQDISLNPGFDILSQGAIGGTITLNSGGDISLTSSYIDNRSFNSTPSDVKPTGGDINITANSLLVGEISRINASTEGFANAGDVNINVSGKVKLDYSDIFSRVNIDGVGDAGNLNINVGSLEVIDGSQFQSRTLAQGNAGDINITARDEVKFAGIRDGFVSLVDSEVSDGAVGDAGDINIRITNGSLNIQDSAALSTRTRGDGNAGNVNIDVSDNVKMDFADIFSSVISQNGNQAGDININANSVEVLNGSEVSSYTSGIGDAGNVDITANTIKFNNINVFTSALEGSVGNAGNVTINGRDSFNLDNSQIFTDVETNAFGNAGEIKITTPSLSITNGSQVVTTSSGIGNAADVNITAQDISLDNSQIFARLDSDSLDSLAIGNSGNINIDTKLLQMSNGAQLNIRHDGIGNPGNININADTVSLNASTIQTGAFSGNAGNINIQTNGSVSLKDSIISAFVKSGNGEGGDITIDAKSLFLTDFSSIGGFQGSDTTSEGSAGNITVKTDEFVTLDNSSSMLVSAFTGSGGEILIDTKKLSVQNGSIITAIVFGDKPAASLTVNATDSVEVSGFDDIIQSGLLINTFGDGDAGTLTINTGNLIVKDGAFISTSAASSSDSLEQLIPNDLQLLLELFTGGTGKAGNLEINASESVQIIGSTPDGIFLSSLRSTGGGGDGGKINITTPSLTVTDGAEITAITTGVAKGGTIEINAPLSVEVTGSHPIFNSIRSGIKTDNVGFTIGKAGNINITTPLFKITNGGTISALTRGGGEGGTIDINSKSISLNNGARITARTFGEKKAGKINLTADTLEANRSQITTSTSSSGKAGDITLTVKDNITLTGENAGIFSNTRENSTGDGGKIIIDPILFTIEDGAAIAVNSLGTGIGGDIELTAGTLNLDNGTINAQTRSNTGGNITLNVNEILFMRRNSKISTTAGNEQFGGNGGNITINSPFIVAFPTNGDGNDITANAFLGNGGNVNITSEFLFGIESRDKLTAFNDITASSDFAQDGTVEINTPGIDPTRGLIQLPDGRINPQINQNCQANVRGTKGELFLIGKGGFPHNPETLYNADPFTADLIPLQPAGRVIPKLSTKETQLGSNNNHSENIPSETLPCQGN